jgi:hypothetical protein
MRDTYDLVRGFHYGEVVLLAVLALAGVTAVVRRFRRA